MKRSSCYLMLVLACGLAHGQQPSQPWPVDPTLTHEIGTVIRLANALHPGVTRADILKDFTTEGGLSTREQTHYVYKRCPYIKIDVTFDVAPGDSKNGEAPSDKVATVSRPYLELSVMD